MSDSYEDLSLDQVIELRKGKQIAKKLGMHLPDCSSNHLTPTIKSEFSGKKSRFFELEKSVSDKKPVIKRRPKESAEGYPYRPARLVHTNFDLNKAWYIVFYAWDLGKQQLVRKRVYREDFAAIPTKKQRLEFAKERITHIDFWLKKGMFLESMQPKKKVTGIDFRGYSILNGIDYVINYKKEIASVDPGTVAEYKKLRFNMVEFLKHKKLTEDYKLRDVNDTFIDLFFEFLKTERKIANSTYNNRRGLFHAVFEILIRRDRKLFKGLNPIKEVQTLKTETRKHAAYTHEQMAKLRDAIDGKEKHLLLFIQFMIYSLARPAELRFLKVGHIRMAERRILFLSESAKTSIEEYIGISDRFAEIILQSKILNYPPEYYVFSNTPDHTPGPEPVGKNYFYKRISRYIKSLGFLDVNPNYTLYSFCHTGAISLYMETKDIKLLQRQKRHQNVDQTNTYLRDLGLFSDFDQLNKWKGPI